MIEIITFSPAFVKNGRPMKEHKYKCFPIKQAAPFRLGARATLRYSKRFHRRAVIKTASAACRPTRSGRSVEPMFRRLRQATAEADAARGARYKGDLSIQFKHTQATSVAATVTDRSPICTVTSSALSFQSVIKRRTPSAARNSPLRTRGGRSRSVSQTNLPS